jgi:hypothetical protein
VKFLSLEPVHSWRRVICWFRGHDLSVAPEYLETRIMNFGDFMTLSDSGRFDAVLCPTWPGCEKVSAAPPGWPGMAIYRRRCARCGD